MIILHGAIDGGKFFLWGEKLISGGHFPKKSRGRRPLNPPPEVHPFGLGWEELEGALGKIASRRERGLMWLPSYSRAPLPSSSLLGELPAEQQEKEVSLSPWMVEICPFSPGEIISFLVNGKGRKMIAPGVVLGEEFSFLGELARFTLSLLVRQRYLPTLFQEKGLRAGWEPIFMGRDKERMAQLRKALPPCCRALSPSLKKKEPPSMGDEERLLTFIKKGLWEMISSVNREISSGEGKSDHDIWLDSLGATSPSLSLPNKEGLLLAKGIEQWQQPLKNAGLSPFKFCFRLEEPIEEEGKELEWKVAYLLQSYEDPSLILTIEDVWNPKGAKRKVVNRSDFNARQFILTSLGVGLGVCDRISKSLDVAVPKDFSLNSKDAIDFLNQEAPLLEELGFGVICPNWWKKGAMNLSSKAFISSPFQEDRKQSIWEALNVEWKMYLGQLPISKEELYELALLKDPIIKMRGHWVLLNQDQIQKAVDFLEKNPCQPKSLLDLMQLDAGVEQSTYGIEVEGVEAEGWIKDFLQTLKSDASIELIDPPKGFQGTLRPYQLRGYSWMSFLQKWQLGACLADDMGLGKTPQTLAMLMEGWEKENKPSLLVCPTSLTGNWSREGEKFVPDLPIYVHHGPDRLKGKNFEQKVKDTGLVITSYALLHRDSDLLKEVNWRGVILDEAQNIKNAGTKQAKAACTLEGNYRLALTGTPVENNVGDLWSLMHFLNPGYLGTEDQFRETFFKPIQMEKDPQKTKMLKQLTKPLILRRLKTDRSIISDLPEKIEMNSYCSLTPEQVSLYESVVADANGVLDTKEGIDRKGVILATLSKLKQICNHPANFLKDEGVLEGRSGKLARLEETLEEIYAVGDKCLIFTQYTGMGELLKKHIEENHGKETLFLHGGVKKKERDKMVEAFQKEKGGPSVFLLSIKAGGVGLTLTQANHVIHFDRWWNPAVENQATDRAFRIGQKKNVMVHKLISTGTIEEKIDEMIASKKEVAENVVGEGEGWLTELSTENLKELWKLQSKVVA